MSKPATFVLVVDAARARSFRLNQDDTPGAEICKLSEGPDWVHPEARVKPHDRYEGSSTRGHHGGAGGQAHVFDDHRERHDQEDLRRFAQLVAQGAGDLSEGSPARFVISVSHSMSPALGKAFEPLSQQKGVRLEWMQAELTSKTAHEVHVTLAGRELLPAPRAPRVQR